MWTGGYAASTLSGGGHPTLGPHPRDITAQTRTRNAAGADATAPLVVALADPRPGESVLDVACGTGVVSRRREASATAMPLPDGSFDVVYCQLGLQFFPDRAVAPREMHRVLAPGGRLGLMVWRGIEHSPGFGIFAAALGRHVSSEAAGMMRAPFALSDAEELRGLIGAAGFRDVTIRPAQETVRFPSVERFVQDQVAGSPLAGHVAKVSDEARGALAREIGDALSPYLAGAAVAFPIGAHLASART